MIILSSFIFSSTSVSDGEIVGGFRRLDSKSVRLLLVQGSADRHHGATAKTAERRAQLGDADADDGVLAVPSSRASVSYSHRRRDRFVSQAY